MFCPRCGQVMVLADSHAGRTFKCVAGDMPLSRVMHNQLTAAFACEPKSSGSTSTGEATWFCPACGTPMANVDGHNRCTDCGRSVDRFIYGLVEFHPHRATPRATKDAAKILLRVGGLVDETGVRLGVYGENLDPPDVTAIIGREPTSAHRKGDRRGPRSPPYKGGAWFYELRGEAPQGPAELSAALLDQLPDDAQIWAKLSERYDVQLRYGIHMTGWNRGFDLPADVAVRIARLRAAVMFDIYAYDDDATAHEDDGSGQESPGS